MSMRANLSCYVLRLLSRPNFLKNQPNFLYNCIYLYLQQIKSYGHMS
jgi:hypothetical protein